MNDQQTVNSSQHGIKWGLIIGSIYTAFVFLRYGTGANNPVLFSMFTFIGYIAVLLLLFYSGYQLRKQNGGWIPMKEAFKSLFISVLIFELLFAIASFVYLKIIDPDFFDKLRLSTENILIAAKQSQGDIDKITAEMDTMAAQTKQMNVWDFLRSYLTYVGITGLFALLFAFILKRKPTTWQQDQYPQS